MFAWLKMRGKHAVEEWDTWRSCHRVMLASMSEQFAYRRIEKVCVNLSTSDNFSHIYAFCGCLMCSAGNDNFMKKKKKYNGKQTKKRCRTERNARISFSWKSNFQLNISTMLFNRRWKIETTFLIVTVNCAHRFAFDVYFCPRWNIMHIISKQAMCCHLHIETLPANLQPTLWNTENENTTSTNRISFYVCSFVIFLLHFGFFFFHFGFVTVDRNVWIWTPLSIWRTAYHVAME